MTGMFSILTVFPKEKLIINRERSSKAYALSPFFFSRVMADLPMIVFPLLMCTIVYFLAGFKPDAASFFETAVTCILGYLTAASIGLLVGSFAPNLIAAQGMVRFHRLYLFCRSVVYVN
jgi:ABC-type multidrug transport system permease subunit